MGQPAPPAQRCSALPCPSPRRGPRRGCASESGFGLSPRLAAVSTDRSLAGKSAPKLGKGLGHPSPSTSSGNPSHRWERAPEEAWALPGTPCPMFAGWQHNRGVQRCASVSPLTPACPGLASARRGVTPTLEGAGALPWQRGVRQRGPRQRVCCRPKLPRPLDPRRAWGLRLWVRCRAVPPQPPRTAPWAKPRTQLARCRGGVLWGTGPHWHGAAWPALLFLNPCLSFPAWEKRGLLASAPARRSPGPVPSAACRNRHSGCPGRAGLQAQRQRRLPGQRRCPRVPEPVWKGLVFCTTGMTRSRVTSVPDDRRGLSPDSLKCSVGRPNPHLPQSSSAPLEEPSLKHVRELGRSAAGSAPACTAPCSAWSRGRRTDAAPARPELPAGTLSESLAREEHGLWCPWGRRRAWGSKRPRSRGGSCPAVSISRRFGPAAAPFGASVSPQAALPAGQRRGSPPSP